MEEEAVPWRLARLPAQHSEVHAREMVKKTHSAPEKGFVFCTAAGSRDLSGAWLPRKHCASVPLRTPLWATRWALPWVTWQ